MGLATPSCAAIDAGCSRLWFFSISCVLNTSVKTRLSVSALAGLPTRIKFCTSIVWRHIVPPVFVSINQMRPKAQTILNAFLRQISFCVQNERAILSEQREKDALVLLPSYQIRWTFEQYSQISKKNNPWDPFFKIDKSDTALSERCLSWTCPIMTSWNQLVAYFSDSLWRFSSPPWHTARSLGMSNKFFLGPTKQKYVL